MARQRYCCGLARCWRPLRLSVDRAGNAARKPARKAGVLAQEDKVLREADSPLEGEGFALSYKPYPCGRPLHAAIDAAPAPAAAAVN
jgi:hypothetical protein